jgi:hypothetical protein
MLRVSSSRGDLSAAAVAVAATGAGGGCDRFDLLVVAVSAYQPAPKLLRPSPVVWPACLSPTNVFRKATRAPVAAWARDPRGCVRPRGGDEDCNGREFDR